MNRFNFGNQITNGLQIASVGAVTSHSMYDASSTLNNMSPTERRQYGAMGAERAREQIRETNNKVSGYANLTDDEQIQLGEHRSDSLMKFLEEGEEEELNTPQFPEIKKKVVNGVELTGRLVYQYRNSKSKFAGYEPVIYQNKKGGNK